MTSVAAAGKKWTLRSRTLSLDTPLVMGVVNVTPDSFSDGGNFFSPDAAFARAEEMAEEGADIIDIGGESTRPQGAAPVDAAEERRRVIPVVERSCAALPVPISVDTVKSTIAEAALGSGAEIVNDVSALRLDPRMGAVCASAGAGVILMHSRGGVSDMATYAHADYGPDVTGAVIAELQAAIARATDAGIAGEAIALDPGIGFAKRSEQSIALLAELPRLVALGFPVVVGVSRKRVIGELTGASEPADRLEGTIAANVLALAAGARVFRVHDVRAARRSLDVAWAVLRRGGAS